MVICIFAKECVVAECPHIKPHDSFIDSWNNKLGRWAKCTTIHNGDCLAHKVNTKCVNDKT